MMSGQFRTLAMFFCAICTPFPSLKEIHPYMPSIYLLPGICLANALRGAFLGF